jgi:hypothetical protein
MVRDLKTTEYKPVEVDFEGPFRFEVETRVLFLEKKISWWTASIYGVPRGRSERRYYWQNEPNVLLFNRNSYRLGWMTQNLQ